LSRDAFTLVEVLVVIGIVTAVAAMILVVPSADRRDTDVRAAADELAAVLRSCRSMAMQRRGVYGVSFNIENQPGSTGRLLNNRSGGHWYRIIGPREENAPNLAMPGSGFPPMYSRNTSSLNGADCQWSQGSAASPVRYFLEAVDKAWVGDRRQLPAGKVRFVALTDQDNGDFRSSTSEAWAPSTRKGDTYAPTYPRPWFGWWETATGRLHAWGGYDPTLAMTAQTSDTSAAHPPRTLGGRTISHSGFFYEGYDGIITGCRNPSDRDIYDDTDGSGLISSSETSKYRLWRADDPRPLINGRWLDCLIYFLPDGTAVGSWMGLRHACAANFNTTGNLFYDPSLSTTSVVLPAAMPAGKRHMMELGPGDMCNRMPNASGAAAEGSWSATRSGYFFITLGPDLATDVDTYPSASSALRAIMPLYRVGISIFGEIVVRRVMNSSRSGIAYETTISGAGWQNRVTTDNYYRDHQLITRSWPAWERPKYDPRGTPLTDFVTETMLENRLWWKP
jgi:type II secretory pathway pseudopilin PulG